LLLIPLIEIKLAGAISFETALAWVLVPSAYVIAFASYRAAGTEEVRHLLPATLLYRFASLLGMIALAKTWLRHRATLSRETARA
jgi:hypothetical protein